MHKLVSDNVIDSISCAQLKKIDAHLTRLTEHAVRYFYVNQIANRNKTATDKYTGTIDDFQHGNVVCVGWFCVQFDIT